VTWGTVSSSDGTEHITCTAVSITSSVLFSAGFFDGSSGIFPSALTLPNAGPAFTTDGFVLAQSASTGAGLWAVGMGGAGNEDVIDVALSGDEAVVAVVGIMTRNARFGTFNLSVRFFCCVLFCLVLQPNG
jgi:hypothetical protein